VGAERADRRHEAGGWYASPRPGTAVPRKHLRPSRSSPRTWTRATKEHVIEGNASPRVLKQGPVSPDGLLGRRQL
jgi:hypothetical protein